MHLPLLFVSHNDNPLKKDAWTDLNGGSNGDKGVISEVRSANLPPKTLKTSRVSIR